MDAPESGPSTLQPADHRRRFLDLQSAARAAGSASDPVLRANTILALIESYRHAATLSSLLPHDWDIHLALRTRLAAESGALSPTSLQAIFDLHKDASAHYRSPGLIKRYISLVIAYCSQLHNLSIALPSPRSFASDPALKWTSLDSCPSFDAVQSTYNPASLPRISREEADANEWETVCGIDAARGRIREAYTRCAYALQESQDVWRLYLAFEEAILGSAGVSRDQQLETIRQTYLARLRVPHAAIDDTFQAFSSFVTHHLPPHQYESEMSAANVLVAESRNLYRQREQYEDTLTSLLSDGNVHVAGSRQDLDSFAAYVKPYLRWQSNRASRAMRSKDKAAAQAELELTCGLYERLIPHFGLHPPASHKEELVYYAADVDGSEQYDKQFKRLSKDEKDARTSQEQQLYSERLALATDLWLDYISVLTSTSKPDASLILDVCTRSVHCLPTSVSLHCVLMRHCARFRRSRPQIEHLFERVISAGALSLSAPELTDLCLARIDCERELATYELIVKANAHTSIDPASDMDKFTEIYALISYALSKLGELGQASAEWDASMRLERCAVNWVERAVFAMGGPNSEAGAGFNELAEAVWTTAVAQQPENAKVYTEAAGYWMRRFEAKKARGWFKAGVAKLERKQHQASERDAAEYQRLVQEWVQFEHEYGSAEEVEVAEGKARAERQRAVEAWYAQYAQYGYTAEQAAGQANGDESAMQVEPPATTSAGKRKAEEDVVDAAIVDAPMSTRTEEAQPAQAANAGVEQPKKTRTSDADSSATRDREHCSVLVSNLDASTDAQAVRSLLRGCGRIVELSGPIVLTSSSASASTAAALVEFSNPTGAASALTRHGKSLNDSTVAIHIGWKCTLFVTNFPESWSDADVRSAFSAYGLVFNVRWPSKRFASSRRFCYVQYTSPSSAEAAVAALNNHEVAEGRKLSVALSDPSRRKPRSDAHDNERELFVSGLPRNINEDDVQTYFEAFGAVSGVRLLRNAEGALRGLGFVDFANVLDAHRAMRELNSTKWRGKTISVTIADSRAAQKGEKGKGKQDDKERDERRERSVRVEGVPVDAQEALIQQALEHAVGLGKVKQVSWRPGGGNRKAVVEFKEANDAGRAVLVGQTGGVRYGEQVLKVLAMDDVAPVTAVKVDSEVRSESQTLAFVPRASRGGRGRGRGRAAFGVGFHSSSTSNSASNSGNGGQPAAAAEDMDVEPATSESTAKLSGQDRFRAMLNHAP